MCKWVVEAEYMFFFVGLPKCQVQTVFSIVISLLLTTMSKHKSPPLKATSNYTEPGPLHLSKKERRHLALKKYREKSINLPLQ